MGRYAHLLDKLARTGLLGLRCARVPFNAVIARRQKLSHFPLVSVERFALSVGGAAVFRPASPHRSLIPRARVRS